MKTYTIKNTDIMHNGKLFPEGSPIDLEENEAETLSDFLEEIKKDVTLSGVEGSSLTNNKEQSTKNNKRNK